MYWYQFSLVASDTSVETLNAQFVTSMYTDLFVQHVNKHLWLSSTKTLSASWLHAWLHAVGDPRIRPRVEPDKVSLCRVEVMNLSPFHGGIPWSPDHEQQNKSSRDHREVKHSVFMKSDMAVGATLLKARRVRRSPAALTWNRGSVCGVCSAQLDSSPIARIFEMSAAMQNSCSIINESRHTTGISAK